MSDSLGKTGMQPMTPQAVEICEAVERGLDGPDREIYKSAARATWAAVSQIIDALRLSDDPEIIAGLAAYLAAYGRYFRERDDRVADLARSIVSDRLSPWRPK